MTEVPNLMEGLLNEMLRVSEMIGEYKSIPNNAGMLAAKLMELDVQKARNSIINDDIIQMMIMYEELKKYEN